MEMEFVAQDLSRFNKHGKVIVNRARRENVLLPNQLLALQSLLDWFSPNSACNDQIAVISMPTGSGKTGVMACLPYFLGSLDVLNKPILVIAPGLELASQLERQLSPKHVNEMFLVRRGILSDAEVLERTDIAPKVEKIDRTQDVNNRGALLYSDIIIANAQKFISENWENELPNDLFSVVMIDEAHHHPAKTWKRIVEKFQHHAKVVFFTATPYRGDGRNVLENMQLTYHLSREEAVRDGIIRRLELNELPDLITDVDSFLPARFSEEEREDLRKAATVLCKVGELLRDQDENHPLPGPGNVKHMAIAITKDVDHSNKLLEIWNEIYPDQAAETYNSQKDERERQKIMERLKNNQLRLIIVVQMLLEGFDYPPISIAAITMKIVSPVKFAQFVGRAQRIYRGPTETEANGLTHVITHTNHKQRRLFDCLKNEWLIPDDNAAE